MLKTSVADKASAQSSASKKSDYQPKYNKPHMIIPVEDSDWALQQVPSIQRFWLECWKCDPYGSRWMPLSTNLTDKTLKKAKKALRNKGLFDFKVEMRILEGKRYYETFVINLHGSRVKAYWLDGVTDDPTSGSESGEVTDDPKTSNDSPCTGVVSTPGGVTDYPTNVPQMTHNQESQQPSVSSQEHFSNSSKEVLECNDLPQQVAAPCGGASPAVDVEEILPVAAGDGQPINYFVTPGFDPVTAEKPQVKLPFLRDREARLKRIKAAMNCGEFPGFQFLVESMQDVKLRGEIQRLLAKYPEWRVAIIDQQLIQFDSA